LGRRKDKQALTQYITADEVDDGAGENAKTNSKKCRSSTSCRRQRRANALLCFAGLKRGKS